MSDEFDKEAEREKLREKFAEDEKKREHTQRMSELLLQGATMTNRHCDTCGDPIFRHDGREFCPTCHATEDGFEVPAADETGAEEAEPTADAGGTASSATTENRPESAAGGGDPTARNAATGNVATGNVATGNVATGNAAARDAAARDAAATDAESTGFDGARDAPEEVSGRSPSTPDAGSRTAAGESTPGGTSSDDAAGGVAAARESLTRTLNRFARAAEETDDPRRARDHLRAAREAAEALAALD
ncbi:Sjogren's syndrome/scleroderma autoantigen 1 family protein [Halorubrum cibi]|uniref:Sjogren's syndrome/scleroderma autoantigen 1 (Autoantigen p27) n=1 Tax=Halorubrum cibi TaxID=413815 RepID=A0A521AN51_9EURY|nr:Sjogren's syndrome/scleroderma autoantigen 1 family protein [Halorubrum cibi]SMO36236.1 Sjogren's syndrome/scleroderma autoantigen 1 (Autoantigen p27) [Halorubrum cibi]